MSKIRASIVGWISVVCVFLALAPSSAAAQVDQRLAVIAGLWGSERDYAPSELIAMLQSADRDERAYAAMRLGDAEISDAAISALVRALGDNDEDVRLFATASLAKIGEPAAPQLARALGQFAFTFEFRYHSEAANDWRTVDLGVGELAFAAITLSRYEHREALLANVSDLPRLFQGAPGVGRPALDPIERAWGALLAQDNPSSDLVMTALSAPFDETRPPAQGERYTQKERVTRAALQAAGRVEAPTAELIAAVRSAVTQPATETTAVCALVALGLESRERYFGCVRDPPLHDYSGPSFQYAVATQLPDWFDDGAAARAFSEWTTHTPAAGASYRMVARALIMARLGRVADLMDPPSGALVSAPGGVLPQFPWPPPPGFRDYVLPDDLTHAAGPSMGDVAIALTGALRDASGGRYTFGFFAGPPDGYILLARMERINRDGSPLNGRARWMTDSASMSFVDVISELFFERPGYFRVIAFAVTEDPTIEAGTTQRIPEPQEGRAWLPMELARAPMEDRRIHAIVYSFERQSNGGVRVWTQGVPPARTQIEAAGIVRALQSDGARN